MGIGKVTPAAVFLDRDGVLNPTVLNPVTGRMESPLTPDDFHLVEGVIPALLRLLSNGYLLVLVSNQPNFALGKCSLEILAAIHRKLLAELDRAGITFTRFSYCLHHPRGVTPGYAGFCVCRKPSPWFLLRARDDFQLSLAHSWMIGDQPTDIRCGRAAGVRTIRVVSNPLPAPSSNPGPKLLLHADPAPDYTVPNLLEAAEIILAV